MKCRFVFLATSLVFTQLSAAADVVSDWKGERLASRCPADAHADLMRDWSGQSRVNATQQDMASKQVQTRAVNAAYADLMRDWDGRLDSGAAKQPSMVKLAADRQTTTIFGRS
jgi:hypothetical protein